MPSIWGQDLDLSYRPRLVLADINKEAIWSATSKHYQDLKHQYIGIFYMRISIITTTINIPFPFVGEKNVASGSDNGLVVCVNLLDDTGFEGPLTEIYESSVKRFNDLKFRYESFPMNKWCKKMNYTNMDILLDRVRLPLINSGWFVAEGGLPSLLFKGSLRVSKIQTGATRVSCLDSLDRTNLTCSIFARYMIPYQIQSIAPGLPSVQVVPAAAVTGVGASEVRDPVASQRKALDGGYALLTNLWADSGDSISLMYAGTGALKADVTRTGKRQVIQGSYADGVNSLTRYFLNNVSRLLCLREQRLTNNGAAHGCSLRMVICKIHTTCLLERQRLMKSRALHLAKGQRRQIVSSVLSLVDPPFLALLSQAPC